MPYIKSFGGGFIKFDAKFDDTTLLSGPLYLDSRSEHCTYFHLEHYLHTSRARRQLSDTYLSLGLRDVPTDSVYRDYSSFLPTSWNKSVSILIEQTLYAHREYKQSFLEYISLKWNNEVEFPANVAFKNILTCWT